MNASRSATLLPPGEAIEILIVEDSRTQAERLAHMLEQHRYRLAVAGNGREALAAIAERRPALVISDVVMPEMDGPTLMKRLRSEHPDLKIIFISGYAEDAFRRNLDENEDFMFLQKPFDLKELAAAVKAALQR